MKAIIYISILATLAFGFNACDGLFNSNDAALQQEFCFQYEYTNNAWAPQHKGFLIDSSGNVWCYSSPENWNIPDTSGMIDGAALKANLSEADSVCSTITASVLKNKIKLIEHVAAGTLLTPENSANDMGSMCYYAFVYVSKKEGYKRILLRETGDWTIENEAREAEDLYEWMAGIEKGVW